MQCPNCHFEIPAAQGPCPNCGFLIIVPSESFGRRHPVWLISLSLLSLLLVLSVAGFVGTVVYRMVQGSRSSQKTQRGINGPEIRTSRFAVEHGGVASPKELHGHGKLYFVPVGRQAIPVRSLADYYDKKFGIKITVLSEVTLGPAACVQARHQCIAEEVMAAMVAANPEIARKPDSVMIALTDEDIFPQKLGWDFTYSLHSARIGVVSSRRMDPAFWGDAPNDALRLASTKQMLTKYVAMQYFHLPDSFDPTSVLFSPLTPNGGSDNIYESDLHSEASANGQQGKPFPCLFFTYSYKTHEVKPQEPVLSDCAHQNSVGSTDEENFDTNLGWGLFVQRSMDLQLNSAPIIEFKRGYNSGYRSPMVFAFGWGANHSYNPWLSSDGVMALTFLDINHEDGTFDYFGRIPPGRGFSPAAVYESRDDSMYGARLTWDADHYKLQYRDGTWATFLPCTGAGTHCYWIGYQDAKGPSLHFDRGPNQELRQLTAGDNQGITFQSDNQQRTVEARGTNGAHVSYKYDAAGCLAEVHRADGQVTFYEYDPAHRMTSMSVATRPGAAPETILANEYDSEGRVITQTLAGVGLYKIQYLAVTGGYSSQLRITTPEGEVLNVSVGQHSYVVRSTHVRFPALSQR
jgi:YD repeat-containing protein